MVDVRVIRVKARDVFNLTSPRYLPTVSALWSGAFSWWDVKYEPVRDLCERRYIELWNQATGHYKHLEESIEREGFRNPVMLSCGKLERRKSDELPSHVRAKSDFLACEYVGGSRLLIAARLDYVIPAVVNDYVAAFPHGELIAPGDSYALLKHFADAPGIVEWRENGSVYVNRIPYSHYPESLPLSFRGQKRVRRRIVEQIKIEVDQWRIENGEAPLFNRLSA